MNAKVTDPWRFFEHTKPNPDYICAVVIWEELPFTDPTPELYSSLVKWDGGHWVKPDGTYLEQTVIKWRFVWLSDEKPVPEECCLLCKHIRELHHNFESGKGFVRSYCCVNLESLVTEVSLSDRCEGYEKK